MRVLLVNPNREQLPDPVFPLGLAYVGAALQGAGHEVATADLAFSENIRADLGTAVREHEPEVVGLSLRNIDDVAFPRRRSYVKEYKEVVSILRELTDAPIVLGGSGFTIMPRELMKELGADYGIRGEGEESFVRLLEDMESAKKVSQPVRMKDLDRVCPAHGLFNTQEYYRLGGMLNVQTKRGCSFKCIYCTYPMVEGRRVRMRKPESVANELERITAETGVRHFFIVDSVFNNPPRHAEAVCRELIKRKLDISWSAYCTPREMDGKLASLMLEAGCSGVEFGLDSLDDEGLRVLGKSFTFADIEKASSACREAGLKFCHFTFMGAPGDTIKSVREGFSKLDAIEPDAAVIMAGIRVFPRTGLSKLMGLKRIGLEPEFFIEPEVLEHLDKLSQEASARRNWALPGLEINMHERLQRKLRELGIKGSLWEELANRTPRKVNA